MYGYLRRFMGPRAAGVLCALWFAALILGVLYCAVEPPADFRYGRY